MKGGVLLAFKILSSVSCNSISPVGILGFFDSLSMTLPLAWITNSRPKVRAFSMTSAEVTPSCKNNCVNPYLSRMSIQMRVPLSRTRCTQPLKTTSLPASARRSSPQVCVLYILYLFLLFQKLTYKNNDFYFSFITFMQQFLQSKSRRKRPLSLTKYNDVAGFPISLLHILLA